MEALVFGMNVSTSTEADPVAAARAAEDLGFDFVSASDHPCGRHATYETWTMLAWIAAGTSRIKLATRVLGVPNRPPALTAKMAESLNRLSGGRLILGLGGGGSDPELAAFGLRVGSPRDKVDGLEEAIRIVRGLWSERGFSFAGSHYHTEGAELEPKPDGRIPIWLGTFGPRALALTGRLADGWIPSLGFAPPEQVTHMRDRVLAAAQQAGRGPEEITCVYNLEVRVDDRSNHPPDVVSGSPAAVAERLAGFLKLGFGGLNFMPVGPDLFEQMERLGKEVIPALRSSL